MEQHDARILHPELNLHLSPDISSGWPTLNFLTVPRSTLCQRGVISKGDFFSHGIGCIVDLNCSQCEISNAKVILALFSIFERSHFYSSGQDCSCFMGISNRVAKFLGFSNEDIYPNFVSKRESNCDDKRVLIPSTGGDILLYVKGHSRESCLDVCNDILFKNIGYTFIDGVYSSTNCELGKISLTCCNQVFGGGYDLTGFVDGTMNPDQSLRSAVETAVSSDGSSFAYVSKFKHDLSYFSSLSIEHKNSIIGRNYEMTCRQLSSDGRMENPRRGNGVSDTRGHIFRSWGNMLRHAMPFEQQCAVAIAARSPIDPGDVHLDNLDISPSSLTLPNQYKDNHVFCQAEENYSCGLYFVAVACDLSEINMALERMCGYHSIDADGGVGSIDHLFRITQAESGAYFFVPSISQLQQMAKGLSSGLDRLNVPHASTDLSLLSTLSPVPTHQDIINKDLLPSELWDLEPIDLSMEKQKNYMRCKRTLKYLYCNNCESQQSALFEDEGSLIKCMMCNMITFDTTRKEDLLIAKDAS